jgi:hypothetical protein
MLSDRERETLADIERALAVEDPRLVRRFATAKSAPVTRGDRALAWAVGLCLLLSALAFLVGAIGEAAAMATLSGSLAMVRHWLRLSRAAPG